MKYLSAAMFIFITFFHSNCLAYFSKHTIKNDTLSNVQNSSEINNHKLTWLITAKAAGFAGTLIMLDQMWYRDYPRGSFRLHDDISDWKQMDKWGHIASAYNLSAASYESFSWTGLNNRKSAVYGSIAATLFMTSVEILDGFSKEWGFSLSDQAANFIGTGLFLSQQLTWESQKIKVKYSYRKSGLEKYRPDLLGSNYLENTLKDYNGMTFWVSANMNLFTKKQETFPPWLNIAIGYGSDGMLGSRENPSTHNEVDLPQLERYRRWYLSPDIDFKKINTDSRVLQTTFKLLDFLKFPAPAIEYNRMDGWKFYFLYF